LTTLHWALFRKSLIALVGASLLIIAGISLAKPIIIENIQNITMREKYLICFGLFVSIFVVNYLSVLRIQLAGEEDILFTVSLSVSDYVGSYFVLMMARTVAAITMAVLVCMFYFLLFDIGFDVVNQADLITVVLWLFILNMLLFLQNKTRNSDTEADDSFRKGAIYAVHLIVGLLTLRAFLIMPLLGLMVGCIYLTILLYFGKSVLFRYFPAHLQRNIGLSVGGIVLVLGIFNLMLLFQHHRESLLIWGQR
jgi:hypothetical protein